MKATKEHEDQSVLIVFREDLELEMVTGIENEGGENESPIIENVYPKNGEEIEVLILDFNGGEYGTVATVNVEFPKGCVYGIPVTAFDIVADENTKEIV